MAASITAHLQIFKCPQLLCFSTNLDETGIKIHGLIRSFIWKIVIIRDAVPFNEISPYIIIFDVQVKGEPFIFTLNPGV